MNDCTIQLAALDLDGTLLDRTSRITPRTLDALAAAIRRGVVVLPATGRGLSAPPRVAAAPPGGRYALTSHGAPVRAPGAPPPAPRPPRPPACPPGGVAAEDPPLALRTPSAPPATLTRTSSSQWGVSRPLMRTSTSVLP